MASSRRLQNSVPIKIIISETVRHQGGFRRTTGSLPPRDGTNQKVRCCFCATGRKRAIKPSTQHSPQMGLPPRAHTARSAPTTETGASHPLQCLQGHTGPENPTQARCTRTKGYKALLLSLSSWGVRQTHACMQADARRVIKPH